MEELCVTEAELSRRLGVSRAYVNKILKGTANLTIESLVKIGIALDREFKFGFGSVVETNVDILDTEYIYENITEKIIPEMIRPKTQNVVNLNDFKFKNSIVSVLTQVEKDNDRSELAA